MTDHRVWKLDVRGYRLTNILLHILVSLAIFRLIIVLFDDWILALFTGALFVVHPIHTEAVAYISSRADSLAFLFMLLCFIFETSGSLMPAVAIHMFNNGLFLGVFFILRNYI